MTGRKHGKGKFRRLLVCLLSKLPWAAKPSPPAPAPAPAPEPPPAPRLGKTILIIDDDAVIVSILSRKLRARGYDIATAADPPEALAAIRDSSPDLILLDLGFPPDISFSGAAHLDGFGLIRWLRFSGVGSQIPIFIVSGESPDRCKDRCLAEGAAAFFQKPIDFQRLFLSIEQTLWKDADPARPQPDGAGNGP
jgi:CheY-like chemotaxis protein